MAEAVKKEGLVPRVSKSLKATKSELKKVVWPSRKQLINNTVIVVVAIAVVGVILFGLDTAFAAGARFLLGR